MGDSAKGLDRSVAVSVRVHRTDKVDAQILVQLMATDFLSGRWPAGERTQVLRGVTMRRAHLMRRCIRAKSQIHSVLHRSLLPARL